MNTIKFHSFLNFQTFQFEKKLENFIFDRFYLKDYLFNFIYFVGCLNLK